MSQEINNDDINFLDLICVIIRYRILIIVGTLSVALLSFLFFVLYPRFSLQEQNELVKITYTIKVNNLPIEIQNRILNQNIDNKVNTISSLALEKLNNITFISNLNRKYSVYSGENNKEEKNDNEIIKIVNNKEYEARITNSGSFIDVTFIVPYINLEKTKKFINDAINLTETDIREIVFNQFDLLDFTDDLVLEELLINKQKYFIVALEKQYRETFKSFLELNDEPSIVIENLPKFTPKMKCIISTVFSFFIFILIAFISNAILSIKHNVISKEKILNAWNAGKIKKQ